MFKLLALLLGTAHAGTYMDNNGLEQTLLTTSGAPHEFTGSLRHGAFLEFANLQDADLTNANLQDAYLIGANLAHANLEGANLFNANLDGANLAHAKLEGADLSGADFGAFRFGSDVTVKNGAIECPASRQELRSAMNDKSC